MARHARIAVAFAEVMAATVAAFALASSAAPAHAKNFPATTVHGANLLIKSQLDANFCITVGVGLDEGRTITLTQCGLADVQRWAFTWDSDNTNLIVESQGMCLEGHQRRADAGLALSVFRCRPGGTRRFTVWPSGLIENVNSGKCLTVPGAAANVAVSVADCDESDLRQLWKFAH
jgi:hypothetical protein